MRVCSYSLCIYWRNFLDFFFLTPAFCTSDNRGQQWSHQTFRSAAEESEAAGKPAAEVQGGDAHTQGAERPAEHRERNAAGAAAREAAGAGEDQGGVLTNMRWLFYHTKGCLLLWSKQHLQRSFQKMVRRWKVLNLRDAEIILITQLCVLRHKHRADKCWPETLRLVDNAAPLSLQHSSSPRSSIVCTSTFSERAPGCGLVSDWQHWKSYKEKHLLSADRDLYFFQLISMFSHFCGHKYSGIKCSFVKAPWFSLVLLSQYFSFFYQYLHSVLEASRAEVNRRSTFFSSMEASWNCCVGCAADK